MKKQSWLAMGSFATLTVFSAAACNSDETTGDGDGDLIGDGDGDVISGSGGFVSPGSGGSNSGGSTSGGSNSGGSSSGGMGGDNMGGMGGNGSVMGFTFDSAEEASEWALKPTMYGSDFDTVVQTFDSGGAIHLEVTWPHGTPESNDQITKFYIEHNGGPYDLRGQTVSVVLSFPDLGVGAGASNAGCGFDIYISLNDAEYNGYGEDYAQLAGEFCGNGSQQTLTLDVPDAAVGDFDPDNVVQLNLRVDTKYWADGAPFDYEVSEILIDSITWAPTM